MYEHCGEFINVTSEEGPTITLIFSSAVSVSGLWAAAAAQSFQTSVGPSWKQKTLVCVSAHVRNQTLTVVCLNSEEGTKLIVTCLHLQLRPRVDWTQWFSGYFTSPSSCWSCSPSCSTFLFPLPVPQCRLWIQLLKLWVQSLEPSSLMMRISFGRRSTFVWLIYVCLISRRRVSGLQFSAGDPDPPPLSERILWWCSDLHPP